MAEILNRKLVWTLPIIIIFTVCLAAWTNNAFSAGSINPQPTNVLKQHPHDIRRNHNTSSGNYNEHEERLCQPMRFYKTSPPNDAPPRTALHSFPGSGNTWIRHLLHQATGVYTGSVYYSPILIKQAEFLGQKKNDRSVLCIKTHREADNRFARAVILVRNPKDAFVAEFSRRKAGKVGRLSSDSFKTEGWKHFLTAETKRYSQTLRSWIHDFKGRKFVVFYEDLKTNLLPTLNGVVRFLTGTDIQNTVKRCILQNSEGAFLRKGSLNFDPYSSVRDLIPKLTQMKTQLFNEVQECIKAGRCEGG